MDTNCPKMESYKVINTIMAYTNSSRFSAMKIQRQKGINSIDHAERSLKSYAYLAWNLGFLDNASQINFDRTYAVDPPLVVTNRSNHRPYVTGGLLPFRSRDRSRGRSSVAGASTSDSIGRRRVYHNLPHTNISQTEGLVRRAGGRPGGTPSLPKGPTGPSGDQDIRSDTAVGVVLSDIYFFINSKKKQNPDVWEFCEELEQMVCNYQDTH